MVFPGGGGGDHRRLVPVGRRSAAAQPPARQPAALRLRHAPTPPTAPGPRPLERRLLSPLPPVGGVVFLGLLLRRLVLAFGAVEEGGTVVFVGLVARAVARAFASVFPLVGAAHHAGQAHREDRAHLLQERLVVVGERALGVAEEHQRRQALAE